MDAPARTARPHSDFAVVGAPRGARRRSWPTLAAGIGGPLLLLLALSWPLLFTGATFNEDWLNHLWYMWHESRALAATHQPSLFLDSTEGVFYPFYAFYGGTLYTLAASSASSRFAATRSSAVRCA